MSDSSNYLIYNWPVRLSTGFCSRLSFFCWLQLTAIDVASSQWLLEVKLPHSWQEIFVAILPVVRRGFSQNKMY
jgi:hypothetical protein